MIEDLDFDLSYFTPNELAQNQTKNIVRNKTTKHIKGFSSKKVTKKSPNKFVMHNYEVCVSIEGVIKPILNNYKIEPTCILYPTPLNYMTDKPREFTFVKDKFADRVELIKTFWSRYDFNKEPNIKEITENGVILE